jgi:hypothetical protein
LVDEVVDATLTNVEAAPRLDASRPSTRRLAAFALTVVGALLMGLGSLLTWVTVGFSDQLSIQTVSPGTDLSAGLITLIAAVVILVLVIMSRVVAGPARRGMAAVIVAAAALSTALATWFVITASDHYSPTDDDRLVNALAQIMGKSVEEVRSALAVVIDQLGGYTHVGLGPWIAMLGGLLAIAGGILTYGWASRVTTTVHAEPRG